MHMSQAFCLRSFLFVILASTVLTTGLPAACQEAQSADRQAEIQRLKEAVAKNPSDSEAWFHLGLAYSEAAQHEKAIEALREAVRLKPDEGWAHSVLAVALDAKGDLIGAIGEFREAIRLDPKDRLARHALTQILLDLGLPERICEQALSNDPDVVAGVATYVRAQLMIEKGLTQGLPEEIQMACKPKWDVPELKEWCATAQYSLAFALHRTGALDDAIQAYREVIRQKEDHVEAHHNLGHALQDKGDLEGAASEYREAIRLDPKEAELRACLGHALQRKGDLEGAAREYREAIRLGLKDAQLHLWLGMTLRATGDVEGAIKAYRNALKLRPDYAEAHINLGNALTQKGDVKGAVKEYRKALRLEPGNAVAHYNLGNMLYYQQNDAEGAAAELRQAVRLQPNYTMAHSLLGFALMKMGDLKTAEAEWREAIRLDPKFAGPRLGLGVMFKEQGKLEEALEELRVARELAPGDLEIQEAYTLVWREMDRKTQQARVESAGTQREKEANSYYQQGLDLLGDDKLDAAKAAFQEAVRLNPDHAEARTRLGMLLIQEGRQAEAIQEWREAIRIDPNQMFARWLLAGHLIQQPGADERALNEAREHVEAYLKNPPESLDDAYAIGAAHFQLAVIEQRLGREKEALEKYEEALRISPNDSEILNNTAWLYATARDISVRSPQKALDYARKAVAITKQKADHPIFQSLLPAHLDTLAEAYYVNGLLDEAIETEKEALSVNPDCEPCKKQLQKFERAKSSESRPE